MGFRDLRTQERLKHAAGLLANSNEGVKEISSRSGYRQCAGFSRAFKKRTGTTATQFRLTEGRDSGRD